MISALTRRELLELAAVLSLGKSPEESSTADGHDDEDGPTLNRFATTVTGAEITGLFLTDDGNLFFNVQHPDRDNDDPYNKGTVGAVVGANMHDLPEDFASVQTPKNENQRETVRTAAGQYQILAQGGETTVDGEQFGVPYSPNDKPLTNGNHPDFNGFISADDPNEGYLFTNWERSVGMVSRMRLRQNGRNGAWEVVEKKNVDFRDVEGTWTNCFGSVTPWNTPLTSEEFEPDAEAWFEPDQQTYGNGEGKMEEYLGYFGNAYRYGYIVEIPDPTAADPTPEKRFAMGRFSHENSVVMPDRKTVYLTDDGTGRVLFKFVADETGDLSAGTLYAASTKQDGGDDPSSVGFDIEWVELAHATESQVESWIAEYDGQDPNDDPNYITQKEVEQWANGNAADDRVAFLESRKAAAAKGATNEFRKMEGVNVPPNAEPGDYVYIAMSEVNRTMSDDEGDIQLQGNDYGAVYRMQLDASYDIGRMEPVITGGPNANICGGCPYDAAPNSGSSVCQSCDYNPTVEDENGIVGAGMSSLSSSSEMDPENTIANPDNIVVMPDRRVIIGEDSGLHENNMIWVYDPGEDNHSSY